MDSIRNTTLCDTLDEVCLTRQDKTIPPQDHLLVQSSRSPFQQSALTIFGTSFVLVLGVLDLSLVSRLMLTFLKPIFDSEFKPADSCSWFSSGSCATRLSNFPFVLDHESLRWESFRNDIHLFISTSAEVCTGLNLNYCIFLRILNFVYLFIFYFIEPFNTLVSS